MEITSETIEFLEANTPGDFGIYRLSGGALKPVCVSPRLHSLCGMEKAEFDALTRDSAAAAVVPSDQPALALGSGRLPGKRRPLRLPVPARPQDPRLYLGARPRVAVRGDGRPACVFSYSTPPFPRRTTYILISSTAPTAPCTYATGSRGSFSLPTRPPESAPPGFSVTGPSTVWTSPARTVSLDRIKPGERMSFYRRRDEDGTWEHLTGEARVWCGRDALVMFSEDVTDSMELRRQLESAQDRFELAVESAGLGVWEYHIKEHRITSPSHSFKKFGVPDAIENVPQSILHMFDEESRAKACEYVPPARSGRAQGHRGFLDDLAARTCRPAARGSYIRCCAPRTGSRTWPTASGINITDQMLERVRFRRNMQSLFAANPEAIGTFQLNLTRNICGEGHASSEFVMDSLSSPTVDGFFGKYCALSSPRKRKSKPFLSKFDREKLLRDFQAGKDSLAAGLPTPGRGRTALLGAGVPKHALKPRHRRRGGRHILSRHFQGKAA
jgi:hypothetical protein